MKILSNAAKKLKNLVRKEVCVFMLRILWLVNEQRKTQFFALCSLLQGCGSSKCAPSSYHVMPKQNSVPGCKKTDPKCNEKMKMPEAPVDSSTPRSNGKLHFIQTFLEKMLKSMIPSLFLWHNGFLWCLILMPEALHFFNLLQNVGYIQRSSIHYGYEVQVQWLVYIVRHWPWWPNWHLMAPKLLPLEVKNVVYGSF